MNKLKKVAIALAVILFIISNIKYTFGVTGKITAETIRVRAEASTDSKIVVIGNAGEKAEILGLEGDWYKVRFKEKLEFIMGAISISLMIVFWNNNKFICQIPIVNLVVAVGVCLIVWNIFENHIYLESNNTLIFGKIGKYCLEIYLLHCFFTAGYRVLFNKCGIFNLYISMIFNLVLSIGISVLIAKLCKKMGIYEAIFKPFSCISRRKV